MSWETVKLSEVSKPPQYGAGARGTLAPVGPLFVRQTDITAGRIDWASVPFCDLPAEEFKKYALSRGDLLISRLGNGVGNAAYVKEPKDAIFAGYLVRFQINPEKANSRFVGYQLTSSAWRDHVASFRSGAAQPTLNAQQMGAFEFRLPPLAVQKIIAEMLGALDDKIESNKLAIRLIFDLLTARFELAVVDVPKIALSEKATIVLGGTPSRAVPEFWYPNEIPWINSGAANNDIISYPTDFISESGLNKSAAKLMPEGSTVIAITGATMGQVALLGIETAGNQSLVGVWGESPVDNAWLHFAIRYSIADLLETSTGAAQQHVNKANVEALKIPFPDSGVLLDWGKISVDSLSRAILLEREIQTLTKLRDSLLPELLAGRTHVGDVSDQLEEVLS